MNGTISRDKAIDDNNKGGWTDNSDRITELEDKLSGIRERVQEWRDKAYGTRGKVISQMAGTNIKPHKLDGMIDAFDGVLRLIDGKES